MALINGTSGADTLADTSSDDTINGFAGNDTINGGNGGNDVVNGGDGRDSLAFMTATSAVVVDFGAGTVTGGGPGSTSFTNIEKVVTGDFNDQLTGDAAAQNLTARAGADTLWGAGGIDTLWGGAGNDTFIFRETGTANADTLGDWTSGQDTLLLDGAVMTALGASGDFTAGDARFWASSTGVAHDADDRIIFNTTTRQVFYDADGTGSGAAQLIATLQSGATLVATDIAVEGGSGPGPIVGTEGNDTLFGTDGDDTINGLGGNDRIDGDAGSDLMDGGSGNDWLRGSDGDGDTLIGGDGDDTLHGGFYAGTERQAMDGGLGDDLYIIRGVPDSLTDAGGIDTVNAMDTGGWTLAAGFENLHLDHEGPVMVTGIGNELDNLMSGGGSVRLEGRGGNDTLAGSGELFGDAGDDLLVTHGGFGDLTGGEGADTFFFDAVPGDDLDAPSERIMDFASGTDTIRLDAHVMSALGRSGRFGVSDDRFTANSTGTASDDSDRVVYNTSTGELWYDADGSLEGEAQLVAVLHGARPVVATDMEVVNGGTDGDDHLLGTALDDTINGFDGDDLVEGLAGDDELIGGAGADTLIGGDGDDTLDGGNDSDGFGDEWTADTLNGGLGNDVYYAHAFDTIIDSGGIDTLFTSADGDGFPIDGYTLPDELENLIFHSFEPGFDGEGENINYRGNASDNVITISGLHINSSSSLDGREGNDTLRGSGGGDGDGHLVEYIFSVAPGEANADLVQFFGDAARLVLDGDAHAGIGASGGFADGDARFAVNATGTAQDASDRVVYNTSNGQLWYDVDGNGSTAAQLIAKLEGAPTLEATDIWVINGSAPGQVINGTSGADTLADTTGNDTINGLAGNDTINGGHGGNDVVNGGDGRDSLAFMTATSAVVVDFVAGTVTGGGPGSTSFTNIEKAVTGDFDDTLTGNASAQNLTARSGADTLAGAGAVDTLWGGAGPDTFIFRENGTANADVIGDWTSGSDEFALDNAAMGALGADGAFVAGDARFWASSTGAAHDANDRVLFNTSNGSLYYDADGTGSGAAQLIATVQAGATVVATDISVI